MDRLLTVPNVISVIRLACVPWFVYLVFGAEDLAAAAYLLAVLGTTDWVDGYIARRFDQVTTFGKVFDPTVDRIMLVVAGVSILASDAMPLWFGLAALGRELLIAIAGVIVYSLGAARIDVQLIGKAGAMGLMIAFPLFLASASDLSWNDDARVLAWLVGIPGLVLSWLSVIRYVRLAKDALRTGRSRASVDRVDHSEQR